MIFRIINFNREYDIYGVISNEGEQRNVTSFQIIKVMLQGYKFDNAYLTKKGFALQTDSGTRYFQVNMDKQTQTHVLQFLNTKKLVEQQIAEQQRRELEAEKKRKEQEAIRQAQLLREEQQRKQAQQQANKKVRAIDNSNGKPTKINSNNRNQKIFYRGNLYYSEEQLSKKFNADVDEFRKLRYKGYSIDEALGLKPLRPESELVSLKSFNKMMDSMALQRGEY